MIKSIQILNFQSHKDSRLTLHPGVNVVVGSSDSGKTAIIRALRWLVNNKPGGDSFRSNWGGDTSVTVEVDEHRITRTKKAATNEYTADGLRFLAFGADVPEDISTILNINDVNVQQQLDGPFLLGETPGKVAAHFNWVAKLDKIDPAQQRIQSKIRSISGTLDHKTGELKRQEQELDGFVDLYRMEVEIETLAQLEQNRNQLKKTFTRLTNIVSDLNTTEHRMKECSRVLVLEEPVNRILEVMEQKRFALLRKAELNSRVERLRDIKSEIRFHRKLLNLEQAVTKITTDVSDLANMKQNRTRLGNILYNLSTVEQRLKNGIKSVSKLKSEFEAGFPDICPLCDQPVKHEHR